MPSPTPAGILISTTSEPRTVPSPLHLSQGEVMTLPVPPQVGHTLWVCMRPKKVFSTRVTWPVPLHVEQVE